MTETKSLKKITDTLVDHTNDLEKMDSFILKIRNKFDDDINSNSLTPRKKEIYLYLVDEALGLVGDMSLQMFDSYKPLEKIYTKQYKSSPKLGKKLLLQKYEGLHKPYDFIKKRLWKLLVTIKGDEDDD